MMNRSTNHFSARRKRVSGSFAQLFVKNSALLIGMAFEAGILLGRRTNLSLTAARVRGGISDMTDRVVTLAPRAVTRLVPDIFPVKARRPSARRKRSGRTRARS